MKVSELQIGDYVNYRGQIIKITSLYDKGDSNEVGWSDKESVWVNADNVKPILITKEILEKNGFKKDTGGEECWANSKGWFTPHEYGKRDAIKSWEVEICGKINSFDGVIKYVHELQHALRLCGIEKEIVL